MINLTERDILQPILDEVETLTEGEALIVKFKGVPVPPLWRIYDSLRNPPSPAYFLSHLKDIVDPGPGPGKYEAPVEYHLESIYGPMTGTSELIWLVGYGPDENTVIIERYDPRYSGDREFEVTPELVLAKVLISSIGETETIFFSPEQFGNVSAKALKEKVEELDKSSVWIVCEVSVPCGSCEGTSQGILVRRFKKVEKMETKISRDLPKWDLVPQVLDAVALHGGDVADLKEMWEQFTASVQDDCWWEWIERALHRLPEGKYRWDYDYIYISD